MNMKKRLISFFFFGVLFCNISHGEETHHDATCKLSIHPLRIGIRHIQSGGVGYDKGYSSIDLFWTPYSQQDTLLFLDARGHRFTNGRYAANVGMGFRYPHLASGFAYGANFFYDYRRNNEHNFNQLGVGLEALGRLWNFRVNGYLPIGSKVIDKHYSFDAFRGYHLHIKEKSKRSLSGVDAEAEVRLYSHDFMKFFLAAGPYYYNGKHNRNAFGGKARLSGRFWGLGYLAAIASYDGLFGFKFQGEIGITFALGNKRPILKNNSLKKGSQECHFAEEWINQLNRPVERNEIIVLAKQRQTLVAKDPITGQPLHFVHVNNLGTALGVGSFSSPYNTLLGAQNGSKPGDIIYVNAGNQTFIGMDQGITLKNRQQLLGSGISQTVGTQRGTIIIPAFTPGILPSITNTLALGNGINLAASNVVSGFNISGPDGHGIFASGVTSGSIIKYNDIIDSGGGAGAQAGIRILLTPGTVMGGTMEIHHNLITSTNATNDGILINNLLGAGNTGLRLSIHDNKIVGNTSEAINIQRLTGMVGNYFLSGDISNNLLQGNAQEGIYVQSVGGGTPSIILDLDVDRNNITTNGDDGIHFEQARGRLNVTNNFTGSNVSIGIFIETVGTDTLTGKINGNTVASNTGAVGLEIESNSTSFIDIEFMNNTALFDSMLLEELGTSTIRARVSGNNGPFNATGNIILVP